MLGFDAVGRLAIGQIPRSLSLVMTLDPGVFGMTGNDVSWAVSHPVSAGSFSMTGISATFSVSWPVDTGSYLITGDVATFISSSRRPLYLRGQSYWRGR